MNGASRIAVTGASGFLGRQFVSSANAAGYSVRALARRGALLPPGVDESVEYDLAEVGPLAAGALDGCAAVVHLAARIPARQDDPGEAEACWRANALGTLRLVDAAVSAGIGHFVHTVSANAYRVDVARADENTAMYPATRATYYLASKMAQELYAAFRASGTGMAVAALRVSSVYGPGQATGALPSMLRRLLAGEPVSLVNEGRFGADFVHVGDVADAILRVLRHRAEGPFNVGSGERTTMKQVVALLQAATGSDPSLVEHVTAVNDDSGFPALDIGRLRSLGYEPTPMDEGIREMVAAAS